MPINTDYAVGIKREIVTALKPLFGDNFPIEALRNRVYVGLEYPYSQVQYPAIYITYQPGTLRNIGVGHIEEGINPDDGTPFMVKHWYFTGTINFNVMALSQSERDQLGSAIVNILSLGETMPEFETFQDNLLNGTYVDLQYLPDIIHPGGDVSDTVPWDNPDERAFGTSYSIDVVGEFYSEPYTGELIEINSIEVHAYRPDQPVPW